MLDKLTSLGGLQLIVGMVLFFTWIGLVVFKVAGAEQIISMCQSALLILVGHVTGSMTGGSPSGPSVTINPPSTGAPHG